MKLYPNIVSLFVLWLVCFTFIAYFGFISFPHSGKFSDNFFMSLANWDGGHFLGIAEYGYMEKFQYAFFPLYPMLIRALNSVVQNYLFSALLISVMSSFLALNLLYRLILQDFDKKIAQKAILALIFFPTSFYFLTAYSEGLFFLLVIATFFLKSKGKLFWATILASLASATRLAGIALVLAFMVEVLIEGKGKKNWYVFFAPLGFVIYCYYLNLQTSDPFYFITAQTYWLRNLALPGVGFWETIKALTSGELLTKNFNGFLDLIFAVFGLGMIIRSFRFLPPFYCVYGLSSILLPLLTPSLSSIPRFLLPIFPIFILMALVKNQNVFLFYQLISIMLLSAFAILFINGYWVS